MGKCIMADLVYGMSDSGKTKQAEDLAVYIRRTMGRDKVLRLASCSGGGWGTVEGAVRAGLIKPTWLRDRQFPYEVVDLISQGYWPEDPENPESPLIAPKLQPDWATVGGIYIDGISEIAEWLMISSTESEAAGKAKYSAESAVAKFKDGASSYSSPSRALYGVIQNHVTKCVYQSKGIPGVFVGWTALEMKGMDEEGTRTPVYGPDIIGKAKTAKAPSWFDNVLHLQRDAARGKASFRMYLTTHFGDDKIPVHAKNRSHWKFPLPEYLEGERCSLRVFHELLDESYRKGESYLTGYFKEETNA